MSVAHWIEPPHGVQVSGGGSPAGSVVVVVGTGAVVVVACRTGAALGAALDPLHAASARKSTPTMLTCSRFTGARVPPGLAAAASPYSPVMAVTIYGVCALTFMMTMYALEKRGRRYVLGFAIGCVLSSLYGFLSGVWPFGVVELIWSTIAFRRYGEPLTA